MFVCSPMSNFAIGVASNSLQWLYHSLCLGAVVFHQCNAEGLLDPQDVNILNFMANASFHDMVWCCSAQTCSALTDFFLFPLL